MAQPTKVSKSTAINTTHIYVVIALLVIIAGVLIYALAANGSLASGKFH